MKKVFDIEKKSRTSKPRPSVDYSALETGPRIPCILINQQQINQPSTSQQPINQHQIPPNESDPEIFLQQELDSFVAKEFAEKV